MNRKELHLISEALAAGAIQAFEMMTELRESSDPATKEYWDFKENIQFTVSALVYGILKRIWDSEGILLKHGNCNSSDLNSIVNEE